MVTSLLSTTQSTRWQICSSTTTTVTRGVASAGLLASYPWLARTSTASHVVEPIGQIIARTGSVEQRNLPNEESRSLVFDDTNLFELNKTTGLDRVETGTRANFGVQYTFQANSGEYARVLVGQSYHISGENIYAGDVGNEPSVDPANAATTFAENSGLERDESDYVLGAYLAPSNIFRVIGQGRFDSQDLDLRRADVGVNYAYGPLSAQAIYTFATNDPLDGLERDVEDVVGTVSLQLAERWSLIGAIRYDITDDEVRQDSIALRYADECFVLTTTYTETNIDDPERDISTDRTILLRFQLKHIGEFKYRADALRSSLRREPGMISLLPRCHRVPGRS